MNGIIKTTELLVFYRTAGIKHGEKQFVSGLHFLTRPTGTLSWSLMKANRRRDLANV